jgi:hypothetical protein
MPKNGGEILPTAAAISSGGFPFKQLAVNPEARLSSLA